MYFKLILASTALMCVGVVSGSATLDCHYCYATTEESPKAYEKCLGYQHHGGEVRNCGGSCRIMVGSYTKNNKTEYSVERNCGWLTCYMLKTYHGIDKYCETCMTDYCNAHKPYLGPSFKRL